MSLLPLACSAVCTDEIWKPGWSWTYDGTIGPYRVRFELLETDGNISGYYFYASQLKDIRVTGTITDGKRIDLQELGTGGEPEAELSGEFPEKDPQGRVKGSLTCDIITGTWQKNDGSNKLPLFLRTVGFVPDPHGNRYKVAGANDDEKINRAAERFRKAVIDGDQDVVASMIRYPITVHMDNRTTKIDNREQMIGNYGAIFTPGYRKAIENSIPRDMFARYDGIMLGERGEVWFDGSGRVVTLNNFLSQ